MKRILVTSTVAALAVCFAAASASPLIAQTEELELKRRLELLRKKMQDLLKEEIRINKQLDQAKKANAELNKQYLKVEARGILQSRMLRFFRPGVNRFPESKKVWFLSVRRNEWELSLKDNKKLEEVCNKLDGEAVIITGQAGRTRSRSAPPPGFAGSFDPGAGNMRIEVVGIRPVEEKKAKGTPKPKGKK